MNSTTSLAAIQAEIAAIKRQLADLGPLHPGAISLQYQRCGNPTCRCMRAENPERHGPYAKLTYVRRGRNVCRFVRAADQQTVRARVLVYRKLRALVERWVDLSILAGRMAFFDRQPAKSRPSPLPAAQRQSGRQSGHQTATASRAQRPSPSA
jgi:hypothetical protein